MVEAPVLELDPKDQVEVNHSDRSDGTLHDSLSRAILEKNPQCLRELLEGVGNEEFVSVLQKTNKEGDNLLHKAARHESSAAALAALQMFTAVITHLPNDSLTPDMIPRKTSVRRRGSLSKCCDCLGILVQKCMKIGTQKYIDAQNSNGQTPLHLAVLKKCSRCVKELIKAKSSLNIKSEDVNLPFVTLKLFNNNHSISESLIRSMDSCITQPASSSDMGDDDEFVMTNSEVEMDFSLIVPADKQEGKNDVKNEMEFLQTILSAHRSVKKNIFGHPLVASFVFMKWERARKIFLLSLIFHVAIAIIYTSYVYSVFLINCPYTLNTMNDTDPVKMSSSSMNQTNIKCDTVSKRNVRRTAFLLAITTFLAFLEFLKLQQNLKLYFETWRNYFQVIMIMCMYMTVWPLRWTADKSIQHWQYSAAAFGVFHVWSTLLINVGRFPKLGIYVEMLGKVSRNFGYFMVAYVFLLIGFTFAFCVVFPYYSAFVTPMRAVLKVLAMMSGDVEYVEFFYGPHKTDKEDSINSFYTLDAPGLLHPLTAHVLYGSFLVLVTIVLTNLLIGLAVDDIKALQQNSELTQTTRQIAHIFYLESLIFSPKLPNFILIRKLRNSLSLKKIQLTKIESDTLSNGNQKYRRSCLVFRKTLSGLLSKFGFSTTNSSDQKHLEGYTFRISYGDCTSRRDFPEDVFLKAVKIAEAGQGGGSARNSFLSSSGISITT